jgi:hypothetical protein
LAPLVSAGNAPRRDPVRPKRRATLFRRRAERFRIAGVGRHYRQEFEMRYPFLPAFAVVATLAVAATPAAAMGSRRATESNLSAAGFMVRPADTPERQAMLARLPVHKVLLRTHDGVVHYVYADPQGCNCLYVGDQRAYQRYSREMQKDRRASENELAAQEYNDAQWNWGAWGPGFGPGWGWGGGLGW